MGTDGRRSVTPPLSHRPFMVLVSEPGMVETEPARSDVEVPRRRKVVPSWQQNEPEPQQLELPVVTVELADVEAHVDAAVDAAVEAVVDAEMVSDEGERSMPRKKKKELDEAGRKDILQRANAATEARKTGAEAESYAVIGKDYGIGAQSVANLVSRLRIRAAKVALKTKAAASSSAASAVATPARGELRVKGQGLFLRFDRPVQVEIVGLDEYIDSRVKLAMGRLEEMLAVKAKEAVANALRKGIG